VTDAPLETAKAAVLPIYFVADESSSMEPVIDDLNAGLRELLDALHEEGMAAAKIRMTILGFSNECRCYLDLVDMREISAPPVLKADGGTSYAAALSELSRRVDGDVDRLIAQGFKVNRPAVFFLTDGAPTDKVESSWRDQLAKLKDPEYKRRPNILAFGIGQAQPRIILDVASEPNKAYVAATGASVGTAVSDFCTLLVQSIVSSGNAAASGQTTLVMDEPKGFKLAIDEVS
jgi:uncharacterized protein YegL